MTTTPSTVRDRFFVMRTNNAFDECISFDDCFQQRDIKYVVKDIFKATANSGRKMSNYILYLKDKSETKIEVNGWRVEEINTINRTSWWIDYDVKITDPFKILRRISYRKNIADDQGVNEHDLIIIAEIVQELNAMSEYENWKQYDLMKENFELKKELENLKKQLSDTK